MVAQETCPDRSQLESMLEGTLPPDDQTLVSLHLERCPTCQRKFEELADEGELVPETELRGGNPLEPALMKVMEKLAGEGPDVTRGDAQQGEQPCLPFLTPADSPEYLGRLGPYNVVGVIGQGGMGVVLKAHDPRLNRFVAIKVLAPQLAAYSAARKRFLREAQAAAALNHEHVVTIHAVDEFNGFPYIVMEYVIGASLAERIGGGRSLSLTETLRIGAQIAAGLAAAHAQGLVHRDIKPANVLLEQSGGKVKITDFGLARAVGEAQITLAGQITGTPEYMSPEQARGNTLDQRSDLFSLGCVLYAMYSGQSPFRAKTPWDAIGRVCNEQPRPLREINPQTPEWLVEIIKRLLAKNPDDRLQSAAEVAAILARRLAEQSHLPAPSSERPLTAARRWKPRIVAAVALLMLAVGLGFGIYEIVVRIHGKDRDTTVRVEDGSDVKVHGNEVDVTPPAAAASRQTPHAIKTLKKFQPSDALIAKDGVSVDGDAWRIEAKERRVVRLFEVAKPDIENCTILYRAKMKSENLVGRAYLEMWCRAPVGVEAFSRGLNSTVAGTTDWASYEIPFVFQKGESTDLVKLNVAIEGKGTLWIKDVELLKAPSKPVEDPVYPSPDSSIASLLRQGWTHWGKGEMDDARRTFEQVVRLDPNNDNAWNGLGWANFNSGKVPPAEKAFQRAVALNPRHPAALNGLGQIKLDQRKYDEAETYFLKAGPTASAAWFGLARLYLLQGKYELAEKWAQKIVDSGQGNDDTRQMLKAAKDKRLSDELRKLIEPPPPSDRYDGRKLSPR
jgi:serine/threonine protein kinase/tetratricopeptide (TPR) repeat protein